MTIELLCADLVDRVDWTTIPPNWKPEIEGFGQQTLYEYQQDALQAAIKLLYHYYEVKKKYDPNETSDDNKTRKKDFFNDLKQLNPDVENLNVEEGKPLFDEMRIHFTEETVNGKQVLPFSNFVNKMGFWMATGSGKTYVMIKLIQILKKLSEKKLIPKNPILILTESNFLMGQIRSTINRFNSNSQQKIIWHDLKDDLNTIDTIPQRPNEINIYMYKSGNIVEQTKQKELGYEEIDNNGNWYVLLDEAHKGSGITEEQKRQKFFSIISRNGYLFNFSATLTQPEDIRTTVFNFNLPEFLKKGYGKNLYLAQQQALAFRNDFSANDKRKIVLQSLIYLVLCKKIKSKIDKKTKSAGIKTYHNPLLVAFTGSVATTDADLEMFFKELHKISLGLTQAELEKAGKVIIKGLTANTDYVFQNEQIFFDQTVQKIIKDLKPTDIYKNIFNSSKKGEFEWSTIPEHPDQLVFQHKNHTSGPFAVIHIGEDGVRKWREKLEEWNLSEGERLEPKNWFVETSEDKNKVNMLMGSQKFNEGWDTTRPNVMIFINIGVGNARKYVIQAIGRGVRIKPLVDNPDGMKRIKYLKDQRPPVPEAKKIIDDIRVHPAEFNYLETLFLLGTKRKTIEGILEQIQITESKEGTEIELDKNPLADKFQLLIPTYADAGKKIPVLTLPKFKGNQQKIVEFLDWMGDESVFANFAGREGFNPEALGRILDYVQNAQFTTTTDDTPVKDQITGLIKHVQVIPKKFYKFKELDAEINHFKKIKITESDVKTAEIKELIENIKKYPKNSAKNSKIAAELTKQLNDGMITLEQFNSQYPKNPETFGKIAIGYLQNHYFIPIIYGDENQTIIKPIIDVESETKFIDDLLGAIKNKNSKLHEFEWWMFSRIEAKKDDVSIPYYNDSSNTIRDFYPDFIFWLKKDKKYFIMFIDPKGAQNIDWVYKVDGMKNIFSKSQKHDGLDIEVKLFLYIDDKNKLPPSLQQYWQDDIEKCLAECT